MPSANAKGYHDDVREENGLDPNRDFPYMTHGKCMRTTAGRAINEIYREHIFPLALTFHGGMVAIAYEWGSPNHPSPSDESPDDTGMKQLGAMLKNYASGSHYTAGRMNSIVYPVTGGMEDWAYAASWENAPATPCQPTEHGGYDVAKTTYTSDMLNTFNILVETANYKDPWRYGCVPLPRLAAALGHCLPAAAAAAVLTTPAHRRHPLPPLSPSGRDVAC